MIVLQVSVVHSQAIVRHAQPHVQALVIKVAKLDATPHVKAEMTPLDTKVNHLAHHVPAHAILRAWEDVVLLVKELAFIFVQAHVTQHAKVQPRVAILVVALVVAPVEVAVEVVAVVVAVVVLLAKTTAPGLVKVGVLVPVTMNV